MPKKNVFTVFIDPIVTIDVFTVFLNRRGLPCVRFGPNKEFSYQIYSNLSISVFSSLQLSYLVLGGVEKIRGVFSNLIDRKFLVRPQV